MHMFDAATAGNILAKNHGYLDEIADDPTRAGSGNAIARLAIAFALVGLLAIVLGWAETPPRTCISAADAGGYLGAPTCID